MKAYSVDLRERVYQAYQQRKGTVAEVAQQLQVSASFIYKLERQHEALGHVAPLPPGGGPPAPFTPAQEAQLRSWVREQPDATLAELSPRCEREQKVVVSASTLCRVLQKLKLPRKKKTFVAAERDPARRQEFAQAAQDWPAEELIFLDEIGINTDLARGYGRAQPGERVREERPANTPPNTSVIGALGAGGLVSCLAIEGAADGECFSRFVEEMLAPDLQPGQVVLLDNAAIHKSPRVQKAVADAGARLEFLPAYSPDFNPLEECWSKVKTGLRAVAARTRQKLLQGLRRILPTITQEDTRGWFQHAGYNFSST